MGPSRCPLEGGRYTPRPSCHSKSYKTKNCDGMARKDARARPQPPPGRVERLEPIFPCAVRQTGGLWNSLARPDQTQITSLADRKCPCHVEHLSKNCNETTGQDRPPLDLRKAGSDRKRRETRHHNRHARSPRVNLQYENHRGFCAMMVPFVPQEVLSKRGRRDGN